MALKLIACRLLILGLVLGLLGFPSIALANNGSFPAAPISGMQISYTIGGATAGSPTDQNGNPAVRTMKGPLGKGYLQAVGTIKTGAESTEVLVIVTVGGQSKDFKMSLKGTASQSFNVAVPIPEGTTSGTVSINMTGKYTSGSQAVTQTIVVNGLFGDSPPAPPTPPSTEKPPEKTPEKPPEKPPEKKPNTPPSDKSPRWWPPDWPNPFSKPPADPPPVNQAPPAAPPPPAQPPDQDRPAPVTPTAPPRSAEGYESIPTSVIALFSILVLGLTLGISYVYLRKQKRAMPALAANHRLAQVPTISLQGISGPYDGQLLRLQLPVVFGRDPGVCNITFPIDNIRLSRKHATISYDPSSQAFLLQDQSRNGTFLLVEGELNRIGTCRLQPGDQFCLVDSDICFQFIDNV